MVLDSSLVQELLALASQFMNSKTLRFGWRTILVLSAILLMVSFPVRAELLISEVMTNNAGTLLDEDGNASDWIEIHNAGPEDLSLAGHYLSDDPDDLNAWEFPDITLPSGQWMVVFCSGEDRRVAGKELHSNFSLASEGEYLALIGPDKTTIIDAFAPTLPQLSENQSVGVQNVAGSWVLHFFDTPSPGKANSSGRAAEEVLFSIPGQVFSGSIEVSLSCRSGGTISYTTNGRSPNSTSGMTYNGPIRIDATTTLMASVAGGPAHQEVYFLMDASLADFSSNLPVVVIHAPRTIQSSFGDMQSGVLLPSPTDGRTRLQQVFEVNSRGQIRTRGRSTQSFPKKSYRLEFQDAEGNGRALSPLGMPAEPDWILSGRYEEDRSLIRNEFIYAMSNQIGRYAAHTQFCEVFVHQGNGPLRSSDYVGAYSLMEALKRDGDRIDISELRPDQTEEPDITGGYILKVDSAGPNDTQLCIGGTAGGGFNRCRNGQAVLIVEPSRSVLTANQQTYVEDFLNQMVASFDSSDPETGYPAFIDVGSWVDYHLMNVSMLNVDALRLSTYFHKDREGKLAAGPLWDFNISSGSRDRFGNPPRASRWDVWRSRSGDRGTDFFGNATQRWWGDLFQDRDFQQAYCDRWNELRQGAFATENVLGLIDELADQLREAQVRNQNRWPEVPPEYGGFQGEIDHLKQWLTSRLEWMDGELVGAPQPDLESGLLNSDQSITLKAQRGSEVYYTLDGVDPRMSGGGIHPSALRYVEPISLTASATLTAREFMPNYRPLSDGPDQQWSAPLSARFVLQAMPASAENLVISEIMYHPSNASEAEIASGNSRDDAFEFIELLNIGSSIIDLLGTRFSDGIEFVFDESRFLAPGERVVLVADQKAFEQRYGDSSFVAGSYLGQLRNSGETVALDDLQGQSIARITFEDGGDWPTEADGDGYSLELKSPETHPDSNDPMQWTLSSTRGGTPGQASESVFGQTYAQWVTEVFPPEHTTSNGPEEDPDRDGLINKAEFILGGDPLKPDLSPLRVEAFLSESSSTATIRFQKRIDRVGIRAWLESSTDLRQWQAIDTARLQVIPGEGATETIEYANSVADAESQYFRLMVE